MNDEQILRKLAEIEGKSITPEFKNDRPTIQELEAILDQDNIDVTILPNGEVRAIAWNPLTNWSDCGPLLEKYVNVIESPTRNPLNKFSIRELWQVEIGGDGGILSPDLKRAICLAIIESQANEKAA